MKKKLAAWIALGIVTIVAALCLGATNEVTKDVIAGQETARAEKTRQALLPEAAEFAPVPLPDGSALNSLYAGMAGEARIGYVADITVTGFGGPIVVTLGVDENGALTGVSVGGTAFSETAGLGAKAKDAAFTGQFAGKAAPLTVVKAGEKADESTIDAITAATITSRAVTNAVNTAVSEINALSGAEQ